MNIVIGKCYIRDIIIDNKDLVETHWDEVSQDESNAELRISDEAYFELEREDYLSTMAVYDGSNMIGYSVFMVTESIHTGKKVADNDCIYISPVYRKLGIANSLLLEAEKQLVAEGVSNIGISMKTYSRFDNLLVGAGYTMTEIKYSKIVGEK